MSKAVLSESFGAVVRAHFALLQAEPGRYLGVMAGQVAHAEAAREERWLQHLEANAAALPSGGPLLRPLLKRRLRLLASEATALEVLLHAAGYVPPPVPGAWGWRLDDLTRAEQKNPGPGPGLHEVRPPMPWGQPGAGWPGSAQNVRSRTRRVVLCV